MTVSIEAGVELDRAVAEASGLVHEKRPSPKYEGEDILGAELEGWWDGAGYVSYYAPPYSTGLNAAFAAAERVGLFPPDGMRLLTTHSVGGWVVEESYTLDPFDVEAVGYGDTPALAICAAILELKRDDP